MRNTYLKEIRHELNDSRIFFGKNKAMAKALGTGPEEEYQDGLCQLSEVIISLIFPFFLMFFFLGMKLNS